MLSLEQGSWLVKLARESVRQAFEGKNEPKRAEWAEKKTGAFVTIEKFPSHELRGCIGFPFPVYPLWKSVWLAAREAAFSDPRFHPLEREELKHVIFEVSVLSKPEKFEGKRTELLERIKIGKHGLIVRWKGYSGLLLPQVAVEFGWDAEEFLCQTCWKAGLPPDCWTWKDCEIYLFTAQVFAERFPAGPVVQLL